MPRGVKTTWEIMLGADPEFGIIDNIMECQVPADNILTDEDRDSLIGLDGHSHVGELRPDPEKCPLKLVENISRLLGDLREEISEIDAKIVAGSVVDNSDPIGGHIHFSYLKNQDKISPPFSSEKKVELINTLDLMAGVPLLMCEIPSSAKRRRGNYGMPGDYRTNDHGIEYRVPSSWLIKKGIAKGILCSSFVIICENIRRHHFRKSSLPKLYDLPKDITVKAFLNCDKDYFDPYLKKIYDEIRKYEGYPAYAKEISSYFGFIRSWRKKNYACKEDEDILLSWEVRAPEFFYPFVTKDYFLSRENLASYFKSKSKIYIYGKKRSSYDYENEQIHIYSSRGDHPLIKILTKKMKKEFGDDSCIYNFNDRRNVKGKFNFMIGIGRGIRESEEKTKRVFDVLKEVFEEKEIKKKKRELILT